MFDYRTVEEKRREHFRRNISKFLPFSLTGIDKSSPQSEVTLNGVKDHNETSIEKGDFIEFISLLNTVYLQPTSGLPGKKPSFVSTSTISSSRRTIKSSRIEENDILVSLDVMLTQLNDMRPDFLKNLETNCKLILIVILTARI